MKKCPRSQQTIRVKVFATLSAVLGLFKNLFNEALNIMEKQCYVLASLVKD